MCIIDHYAVYLKYKILTNCFSQSVGYNRSPIVFNTYVDDLMRKLKQPINIGFKIFQNIFEYALVCRLFVSFQTLKSYKSEFKFAKIKINIITAKTKENVR